MSTDVASATSGTLRPRPNTRSSIRQSLNLASVSRALADVMHKDGRENVAEREKAPRKPKEVSSRRASTLAPAQAPPRASMDRAAAKKNDDEPSPEAKSRTITRTARRMSALKPGATDSDERPSSLASSPKPVLPRAATLRPRTSNGSSALPKYRPRSMLGEADAPKKPPSPVIVRVGTRRRLSSSDDQKEDDRKATLEPSPSSEKSGRPISPLPHRAALKVNLTSAINVKPSRPVTPEKKSKIVPKDSSSPRHGSSARPTKASKTSTGASVVRSAIPRPPSSASTSSSSRAPHTPKTPTSAIKVTPGSQRGSKESSSLRKAAPPPPESPLSRLSARKTAKVSPISRTPETPKRGPSAATPTSSASMFTEGSSTDSIEAHDVEFMLSSTVSPTAPTPALPRFRTTGHSAAATPQTPTRPSLFLPTRNHLSYLSPDPHHAQSSARPKQHNPGNDRGSILSWEQLAKHTKTLDDEDVERMLSEVPAPFRSGAVSPTPTANLEPESPSLSAMPSPGGYGSISQVLLPDVTPSPAVHNLTHRFETVSSDAAAANAMMLRLQLAAAENRAQERLAQVDALEQQLQHAKNARLHDADALARQVEQLEQQVHGNLSVDSQRLDHIAALEEQLRQAHVARERAVNEALVQMRESANAEHMTALGAQLGRFEMVARARETKASWGAVSDTAEGELELIRSNREMLAVLLVGLDHTHRQLLSVSA